MLKQRAIIQLKGQSLDNEDIIVAEYSATITNKDISTLQILENIIDTEKYLDNKETYLKEKQDFQNFVFSFIDLIPENNSIKNTLLQESSPVNEASIDPFK